jgi:NAD/NADP transhydrogenase alpha subunit
LDVIISTSKLTATDSIIISAGTNYVGVRSDLAAVYADRVVISNYKKHNKSAVQACRLYSNNIIELLYSKVKKEGE